MSRFAAPALLLLLSLSPLAGQSTPPEALASELRLLDATLQQSGAKNVRDQLPDHWDVSSAGQTFHLSSEPLRKLLAASDTAAAHRWLLETGQQVDAFVATPPTFDSHPREALTKILARPEFKDASPPNAWDRFWASVQAWIADLLESIFAFAAQHPTGSQALFWTLIVASVLALGYWLLSLWTRDERIPSLPDPLAIPLEHVTWQQWLKDAQAATDAGDHRQAIRCSYWTAIAFLKLHRAAQIRFTDTPRERLRALAELPAAQLIPLTQVTQTFERGWYAKAPVGATDVTRSLENLKALGCPTD